MAIRILPDPKRDRKAADLAASDVVFIRYTLAQPWGVFGPGTLFYGVPSSAGNGTVYMANLDVCQCDDYQKNHAACYHIRAVRIRENEAGAACGLASIEDVDAYQSDRALDRASIADAVNDAMRNAHAMAAAGSYRPTMTPELRAARIAQRDRIAATAPPLRAYESLFPAIVD